jgi:hypothetical protein
MRLVHPALHALLWAFAGLAVLTTVSLTFASSRTDEAFAWPIQPPLTAALLGACFGGTVVLFVLAARERLWVNVRLAVVAALSLSTLLLVATLLHLDKFALDGDAVPATIAWIWTVVYVVVPPALLVLLVAQERAAGDDPPRAVPVPLVLRVVLAAFGLKSVLGGIVLFVAPSDVAPHWPWAISPLTGRAIASWIIGLGVAALYVAVDHDLRRAWIGLPSLAVIGALGLLAVARYADDLDGGWGTACLLAYLASMVVMGVWGMVLALRSR